MRLVVDIEGLRGADRVCLSGATWAYFRWSAELSGMALFGQPSRQDAESLVAAFSLEFEPGVVPHGFYVDAQHLEGTDPDAFAALVAVYRRHLDRAASIYTRLALVVPSGVPGAVVAGFHGGQSPPFPVHAGSDDAAACAWLGAPQELPSTVRALIAELRDASPLQLSLRTLLTEDPTVSDVDQVARRLGMSARTLQRRLQDEGTTLQREITAQRVQLAQRRLLESNTPVTVIALDLGFATPQHFSRIFREATGQTPSEWRLAKRR